jgi:hypothetical protein
VAVDGGRLGLVAQQVLAVFAGIGEGEHRRRQRLAVGVLEPASKERQVLSVAGHGQRAAALVGQVAAEFNKGVHNSCLPHTEYEYVSKV